MHRTLFLIILILSSFSLSTYAADYYVRVDGDDSKDGKSDDNAWQTLEKIYTCWGSQDDCNNDGVPEFQPGDRILLRAGDEWTGMIRWGDSDGTDDKPITVTSYESGPPPTINGLATIPGPWTQVGTTDIWYHRDITAGFYTVPNAFRFDGVFGKGEDKYDDLDSGLEWYWCSSDDCDSTDSNTLFVYSFDADKDGIVESPADEFSLIQYGKFQHGFYGLPETSQQWADHIVLEGLRFTGFHNYAIRIEEGQVGIKLKDCIVTFPGIAAPNNENSFHTRGLYIGEEALIDNTLVYSFWDGAYHDPQDDLNILWRDSHLFLTQFDGIINPDEDDGDSDYNLVLDHSYVSNSGILNNRALTHPDAEYGSITSDVNVWDLGELEIELPYTPIFTFTIDDIWAEYGNNTDQWYIDLCSAATEAGVPLNFASTASNVWDESRWDDYTGPQLLQTIQDIGCEIASHGWTHKFHTDADPMFELTYTLPGAATATVEIENGDTYASQLVTKINGVDDVRLDLQSEEYDNIQKVVEYFEAHPDYDAKTVSGTPLLTHSYVSQTITNQNINQSWYSLPVDLARHGLDQAAASKESLDQISGISIGAYAPPGNSHDEHLHIGLSKAGYLIARGASQWSGGSFPDRWATSGGTEYLNRYNTPVQAYLPSHTRFPSMTEEEMHNVAQINARKSGYFGLPIDHNSHNYNWDLNGDGNIDDPDGAINQIVNYMSVACEYAECFYLSDLATYLDERCWDVTHDDGKTRMWHCKPENIERFDELPERIDDDDDDEHPGRSDRGHKRDDDEIDNNKHDD